MEIDERCRAFDEDLSALLDGELGAARRAEVEAHVAACANCSRRLAALRAVDGALASLPQPAVPPDLRARLERRLAAERTAARRTRPPAARSRRALLRLVLPAAAAAALALYLALRAPSPPGQPTEPAPIAKAPPEAPVEPAPQIAVVEPGPSTVEPGSPAVEPAPTPAPRIAERQPGLAEGELEALDPEELGVVLDLDTIEDLPVIANLEVLERLMSEEAG